MAEVLRDTVISVLDLSDNINIYVVPEEKHVHWIRWVYASINKHFSDRLSAIYPVYVEGDERTLETKAEFIEIRIDGPFIEQPCPNVYYLDMQINLLVQTHMDRNDVYKTVRTVGHIVKHFMNNICVYKFGDDESLLGVLKLKRELKEGIDVNSFGIVHQDTRITQSTVEGHYRMELQNEET